LLSPAAALAIACRIFVEKEGRRERMASPTSVATLRAVYLKALAYERAKLGAPIVSPSIVPSDEI
jgi:hypothetical protein